MTSLLASAFGDGAIRLTQSASDWREAVSLAGEALVSSGRSQPGYAAAMIEAVESFGPYIVITHGVALAHARPSELVLETGLSLVALSKPVAFGHEAHDPVSLVFGLCALDHDRHIELLAELAGFLAEEANLKFLRNSTLEGSVRSFFGTWQSQ